MVRQPCDMVEMPDGNILALSQDFHTDTVEDLSLIHI